MKVLKEIGLAIVCILVGIALTQMDQAWWYPLAGYGLILAGVAIVVLTIIEIIKKNKK
ncbi:MAG: hypothetical protein K5888_01485 [Lachnospiraceae bacterium]|nr:hypothetical protein [Lachnospiraceae bacterium]